jgi:hypothetical protein
MRILFTLSNLVFKDFFSYDSIKSTFLEAVLNTLPSTYNSRSSTLSCGQLLVALRTIRGVVGLPTYHYVGVYWYLTCTFELVHYLRPMTLLLNYMNISVVLDWCKKLASSNIQKLTYLLSYFIFFLFLFVMFFCLFVILFCFVVWPWSVCTVRYSVC